MSILQLIGERKLLNLALFAAAADKTEGHLFAPYQSGGGFEQRIQRMTRAVVAGVHDHKFVLKTVLTTKGFPSLLLDMNVLRPGRDHSARGERLVIARTGAVVERAVDGDRRRPGELHP